MSERPNLVRVGRLENDWEIRSRLAGASVADELETALRVVGRCGAQMRLPVDALKLRLLAATHVAYRKADRAVVEAP